MLYLAIDQHRKQLTVNLRNESGDVLLKRQVSTQWLRVRKFLEEVQKQGHSEGGFVAILEVCGFNDWLVKLLEEYGCRELILIQPEKRSKKKTDRRDANTLGELLWVNRGRLLAGKKVQGIRRIQLPTETEAEDRQITAVRKRLGQLRTRRGGMPSPAQPGAACRQTIEHPHGTLRRRQGMPRPVVCRRAGLTNSGRSAQMDGVESASDLCVLFGLSGTK